MAGEQAPLDAIQAAVMKSAAERQASQPASDATAPNSGVAQDLSVMADQAKGYTAGVQQGIANGQATAANTATRVAQDVSQANALRAAQISTQQSQVDLAQARANAMRFSAQQQADADQAAIEKAAQTALAGGVIHDMTRNLPPEQAVAAQDIITNSTDFQDAQKALDNYLKYNNISRLTAMHFEAQVLTYAKQYYDALQGKSGIFNQAPLNAQLNPTGP